MAEQEIRLEYNHAQGAIEIVLPSMTRIGFKKGSDGLIFAALTYFHMQPKENLKTPLSQKQVSELSKRWMKNNVVTKHLDQAPQGLTLEDLDL